MNIWILDVDVDNYENLMVVNTEERADLRVFDGTPKKADWSPLHVSRMYGNRVFSNTPGLAPHLPVLDEIATDILNSLVCKDAEMLPLYCDAGKFNLLNVTSVIDCIDYDNSDYKTFRDGKRIMRFTKYAFLEERLEGVPVFRIKDLPYNRPFVSDEFKNLVTTNNLTGFRFELAWSND